MSDLIPEAFQMAREAAHHVMYAGATKTVLEKGGDKTLTDCVEAAIKAYLGAMWRPASEAPSGEALLFFWPAVAGRNRHTPMMRVDFRGSTPHRLPSHFQPLPPSPSPEPRS